MMHFEGDVGQGCRGKNRFWCTHFFGQRELGYGSWLSWDEGSWDRLVLIGRCSAAGPPDFKFRCRRLNLLSNLLARKLRCQCFKVSGARIPVGIWLLLLASDSWLPGL
jgi:hypothetical protein